MPGALLKHDGSIYGTGGPGIIGGDLSAANWPLTDNATNTIVRGQPFNAALTGGNTNAVSGTMLDGKTGFHLNGSSQFVQANFSYVMPEEIAALWTKYASNPVLGGGPASYVQFGQLVAKPGGGWWFFGCKQGTKVYRYESADLITWINETLVLDGGGVGKWDENVQVASVFVRPSDGLWIMLYRGALGAVRKIGLATSPDGSTWTRKDNGGVDDGLFPQFGNNYDPTAVILVGSRYYVYVNGSADHGVQNVYYSDDNFATFSPYANNPIFINGYFCPYVWRYGSYYYMLINRDIVLTSTTVTNHCIALYRCSDPWFNSNTREFLGYPIVNDKAYDATYLDTPTIPFTDIYRTTYAPEFGSNFNILYNGASTSTSFNTQNLVTTTLAEIAARPVLPERPALVVSGNTSFSFWVQFDSLTATDPIFSVGITSTDGSPMWLCAVRTSGPNLVIALLLGGTYRFTTLALAINTLYHVVVVDSPTNRKVYINGNLVGTFAFVLSYYASQYLYIGKAFGARFLDGYVRDFRIYNSVLTENQINSIYRQG